jgi:hypothetical protein
MSTTRMLGPHHANREMRILASRAQAVQDELASIANDTIWDPLVSTAAHAIAFPLHEWRNTTAQVNQALGALTPVMTLFEDATQRVGAALRNHTDLAATALARAIYPTTQTLLLPTLFPPRNHRDAHVQAVMQRFLRDALDALDTLWERAPLVHSAVWEPARQQHTLAQVIRHRFNVEYTCYLKAKAGRCRFETLVADLGLPHDHVLRLSDRYAKASATFRNTFEFMGQVHYQQVRTWNVLAHVLKAQQRVRTGTGAEHKSTEPWMDQWEGNSAIGPREMLKRLSRVMATATTHPL